MRTLKIVVLTAMIATGFQSGAFATEPSAPSATDTVDIVTELDETAETTDGVEEVAPEDATDGVDTGVALTLPDAANLGPRQVEDGIAVYRNTDDAYAVAVNPFEGGTQVLTVLADETAPAEYAYGVAGPGEEVVIDEDGSAGVVDAETGETLAVIDAPWAVDANGNAVPTEYVTDGTNLVQVVDHKNTDVAYPVTADPKFYRCDAFTHQCVKFTKSETKKIANSTLGIGAAGFAATLCGYIPTIVGKAICVGIIGAVAPALGKSFRSAAKNGKCIELHFLGAATATLTRWKTVKC